ncbi:metallopeptidase [Alloprevotella tannerae]|nr:metallopeptidase [Alloprevotella tannerae]
MKLFLLLLHKSLWNSFKDRFSDAQPNAKAPESECKSRTKSHYHQARNKLFYAKTKIISEMAKFDMWKWQNQRKNIPKWSEKS